MRLLVKTLVTVLLLLLLILLGVYVSLTQVLDPNDFKTDIEAAAAQQGVPLKLHGDIEWQIFPQLGLRIEQVELATAGTSLLRAEELAASVAVMPLLKGRVSVAGVLLKGTRIHALRDAQGRVNWALSEAKTEAKRDTAAVDASTAQGASRQFTLAIEQFRIEDANVLFEDRQAGMRSQLESWNVSAVNINFEGQPFSLEQDFVVRLHNTPALRIHSSGEMDLNVSAGTMTLPSLVLSAATLDAPDETLHLTLSGSAELEPLQPSFHIELAPMNLAAWLQALNIELPDMAARDALTRLVLTADLSGADAAWQFSNVDVTLDQTRVQGQVGMQQGGALTLDLKVDQLDADRYLPAPGAAQALQPQVKQPVAAANQSPADALLLPAQPLPLEGLKALDFTATLALGQLQVAGLAASDIALQANGQAGDLNLQQLAAQLYGGRLALSGRLDARQPEAKVDAKGQLTALSLAPLLEALTLQAPVTDAQVDGELEPALAGQTNITFSLRSEGKSLRDWQLGLTANAKLLANQLTVHRLDVEKGFCEIAAELSGKPLAEQDWKGLTMLDDVQADVALKGTAIAIKQIQAGVEHFQFKGRGASDYRKGAFDITAEALVTGEKDAARGCQLADRWRQRELPLRCQGKFDSIGARTCKLDSDRVNDMLRDEAEARAKEKVGKQINKLEDKLKKKLGDDIGGKLFKGLFGR